MDLGIKTFKILTRLDCKQKNDTYYKIFKSEWAKTYNSVHIVDDSPNVWLNTENYDKQITFIVPKEFRGWLKEGSWASEQTPEQSVESVIETDKEMKVWFEKDLKVEKAILGFFGSIQ